MTGTPADGASDDAGPPDGDPLGWCVVANVSAETANGEAGLDIRRGIKHFPPGARLWVTRARWDPGHGRTHAVGRHRGRSGRYVRMVVALDDLENFRVRGIHSARLLRVLLGLRRDPAAPLPAERPWNSRAHAQEYADAWATWQHRVPARIDGEAHPYRYVGNPPPMEIEHEGRTFHLAHFNAKGARYSPLPPPAEYVPDLP
ncbi:hypothetical protein AB0399_28955 [Streptomyces sp. NPDC088194]|uniref:hypothetical protein n=1 Tax=Streptomyces sp. NPDC088194 TaxID=3154931 RepID=UPI00344C8385